MASVSIHTADVRLHRVDAKTAVEKAALATVDFLRKNVEVTNPDDKAELAHGIWTLYWRMKNADCIVAHAHVHNLLRNTYGFWSGVNRHDPA